METLMRCWISLWWILRMVVRLWQRGCR